MGKQKESRKISEALKAGDKYQVIKGICIRTNQVVQARTHKKPHADELVSLELILRFATPKFLKDLTAGDGYIYLGIGGGILDEHRLDVEKDECCLSLTIAELMKYSKRISADMQTIQHVVDYIVSNDTEGGGQKDGIAQVYKAMTMVWDSDEEMQKNCEWFFQALDFKFLDIGNDDFSVGRILELNREYEMDSFDVDVWQKRAERVKEEWGKILFQKALDDLSIQMARKTVSIEKLERNGSLLRLVSISSTALRISTAVRYKLKADVVVHRNPKTGHVHISTAKRAVKGSKHFLTEVIKILRLKEQFADGIVKCRNWKELSLPYTIPASPKWHHDPRAQAIFNGSLTHPQIEPTKQNLAEINWAVRVGLETQLFPPKFEVECRNDSGQHCGNCFMRKFGLWRCMKSIRVSTVARRQKRDKEVLEVTSQ